MNNNEFIIIKNIKEFIILLYNYLTCYPKRYFELRNRLIFDSYNLLELVYTANYTNIKERRPIQVKAIMKVNMIDFCLEQSFKGQVISQKQTKRLSSKLLIINKMLFKWIGNES